MARGGGGRGARGATTTATSKKARGGGSAGGGGSSRGGAKKKAPSWRRRPPPSPTDSSDGGGSISTTTTTTTNNTTTTTSGSSDGGGRRGAARRAAELGRLRTQLALSALAVRDVAPDGNCLFRAVADQLGEPAAHASYRARVCDWMAEHPEDFLPFYDGPSTYETYVAGMRRDGRWAGNLEVRLEGEVRGTGEGWPLLLVVYGLGDSERFSRRGWGGGRERGGRVRPVCAAASLWLAFLGFRSVWGTGGVPTPTPSSPLAVGCVAWRARHPGADASAPAAEHLCARARLLLPGRC